MKTIPQNRAKNNAPSQKGRPQRTIEQKPQGMSVDQAIHLLRRFAKIK